MSIPSSGSSTWRSASLTSSFVGTNSSLPMRLVAEQPHFFAAFAREEVHAVDEPHPVAARAHDEGVGARAVGQEADAAQQVAVRDARRGDDDLARRELLGGEDTRRVLDSGGASLLD